MNKSILAVLAVAALVPGCATMLKSKSSDITVSSATPGADVLVNGKHVGQTPTKVAVSNKEDQTITVRQGGKEESCKLESSASMGWVVLDIATGAGWLVDMVTGNWRNLDGNSCSVAL